MGLDMFLYKTTRVKNFEDIPQWPQYAVTVTRNGEPLPGLLPARVVEIVEEIGYWRKAYLVHKWFKANLDFAARRNGYFAAHVNRDELGRLLRVVNERLAREDAGAGEDGGTPEDARAELLQTKTIVENALAEGDATFVYKADW